MMTKITYFSLFVVALVITLYVASVAKENSHAGANQQSSSDQAAARSQSSQGGAAEAAEATESRETASLNEATQALAAYAKQADPKRAREIRRIIKEMRSQGKSTSTAAKAEPETTAAMPAEDEAKREPKAPSTSADDLEALRVAVDVRAAKDHLLKARKAFNDGRVMWADLALRAIQQDLSVEKREADAPLVLASENFTLAKQKLHEEGPVSARRVLNDAAAALEQYSHTAPEERAAKVKPMVREVQSLAKNIEAEPNAADKIDQWWSQVVDWMG